MLRAVTTAFMAPFCWLRHQVPRLSPWQAVLCAVLCISIGHFSTSRPSTPTAATGKMTNPLTSIVAELSTAASAPGAAPVASVVFSNIAPNGLDASPYSQKKWDRVLVEARKTRKVARESFSLELRHMHRRLAYILSIADEVTDKLRNQGSNPTKDEGSRFELADARMILRRTIGHFSDLLQHVPSVYSRLMEDIDKVRIELSDINASGDSELFYGKAVKNLNMRLNADAARATSARSEEQEEGARPISLDHPEVAFFIQKLHSARAMESMTHHSLVTQKKGLNYLTESMKTQEAWAKPTGRMLGDINRLLEGKVDKAGLLSALEEVARLAKEWNSMIEDLAEQRQIEYWV